MSVASLYRKSFAYVWDAHRANLPNLLTAAIGMAVNNTLTLIGLWTMLFSGKPVNQPLMPYFLALYGMATVGWGLLNFFLGGYRFLGEMIDEGTLEPMLATPRHPLILVGISRSSPTALGDLLQGLLTLAAVPFIAPWPMAVRALSLSLVSALGFAAMMILAGSVSFFMGRGSNAGGFVFESTVSMSLYPVGKLFDGQGRLLLYLTPAAFSAILPMEAVENWSWGSLAIAVAGCAAFLWLSIRVFDRGVRRFKSMNYVGVRA